MSEIFLCHGHIPNFIFSDEFYLLAWLKSFKWCPNGYLLEGFVESGLCWFLLAALLNPVILKILMSFRYMQLTMATVKSPLVFVPQIFFSLQVFSDSPWPEVLIWGSEPVLRTTFCKSNWNFKKSHTYLSIKKPLTSVQQQWYRTSFKVYHPTNSQHIWWGLWLLHICKPVFWLINGWAPCQEQSQSSS